MDLNQALRILREENITSPGSLLMAAGILCAFENETRVSLDELLLCMRRGNMMHEPSAVSEYAALALYRRTGRPRTPGSAAYEDFVTDADEWLRYLVKNGFLKKTEKGYKGHVSAFDK